MNKDTLIWTGYFYPSELNVEVSELEGMFDEMLKKGVIQPGESFVINPILFASIRKQSRNVKGIGFCNSREELQKGLLAYFADVPIYVSQKVLEVDPAEPNKIYKFNYLKGIGE